MSGKRWTVGEESFLAKSYGVIPVGQIAAKLGRSYESTKWHIHKMKSEGRLDDFEPNEPYYISRMVECPRCGQMRTKLSGNGCPVCVMKDRLEQHRKRMLVAYEELPQELKARTNGTFEISRSVGLMGKSKDLKRPTKPDVSKMSDFGAAVSMDLYYEALEDYELALLRLDVDATKQRVCKWRRKARRWRDASKG